MKDECKDCPWRYERLEMMEDNRLVNANLRYGGKVND
jgi:hypothetical protein